MSEPLAISAIDAAPRFEATEGRYRLTVEGGAIVFDLDQIRRESHQLYGELLVRCSAPGADTTPGVVSVANINLSSTRSRSEHAKHLADRSGLRDVRWIDHVEELALRALAAERSGEPAVLLSSVPRPVAERELEVHGLALPRRHPAGLFGDGGSTKSMLALFTAGELARRGMTVLFADWELDEGEQRERQERLCGRPLPPVLYARCTRPLVYEADRLRRIIRDQGVDYWIADSVAFACDGPPEAAEVASRYFQAVRHVGAVGSLHVAHVTKALEGGDLKPFGSVFWHNGFRSTWNVKRSDTAPGEPVTVALHNRKENLGPQRTSLGFELTFTADRTLVRQVNPADVPDLAAGLPTRQRMEIALRRGALTIEQLAEEIGARPDTVRRTAARHDTRFRLLGGGRVSLLEARQ